MVLINTNNSNNIAISTWSRPVYNSQYTGADPNAGRARPIKHWRKQLFPNNNSSNNRSGVGMPSDLPGRTSITTVDPCNDNVNITVLKNNISNNETCCHGNLEKPSSNPKIIRSANTNISKNYYTNTSSYLKSRCKTFQQNSSGIPINNTTEIRMLNCKNNCANSYTKPAIYNPNNKQFATQGAVSSGERLVRLKLNTINNNGASFRSAYGEAAANAGKYHGTSDAPYFIKSKMNMCNKTLYHRNGRKQAC